MSEPVRVSLPLSLLKGIESSLEIAVRNADELAEKTRQQGGSLLSAERLINAYEEDSRAATELCDQVYQLTRGHVWLEDDG